ncbi:MAG: hypothetical protein H5T69_03790, partial [Chloroflexi bacterium]|nr:hypothetical protein [Chloroflexota bacterium]
HVIILAGDQVTLGLRPVILGPPTSAVPAQMTRVERRLGNVARLLGYTVTRFAERLEVTLVWQRESPSSTSEYKVFMHLRDGGTIVSQHDGVPADDGRPVWSWRPGEIIVDRHSVPLDKVKPGIYALVIGLYDPISGARVPAYDSLGRRLASDEIPLASIRLEDNYGL